MRAHHRRLIMLALCGALAGPGTVVAQADTASIPELKPGESTGLAMQAQAWRLELAEGDVVQGRVSGSIASLDLQDAQGRHLRRLIAPGQLTSRFMFVAPGTGSHLLRAAADAQGPFTLHWEKRIPVAEQRARPDLPDSPTLQRLAGALAQGGSTAAFWHERAQQGTPLVENLPQADCQPAACDVLVTFLWRGARRNVMLFSSPSGEHDPLHHLGQSDVWFRSYRVPATTRLSYQLAPDVPTLPVPAAQQRHAIIATAQRDPLNPHVLAEPGEALLDAYQGRSVLELPAAPSQPWVHQRHGVAQGTLERLPFTSQLLGNTRDIHLYRSPGWQAGATGQNLLVLFDAHAYLGRVPTPTILDNLLADGWIGPTAAILVANPDGAARSTELPANPHFARFLAEELMPWAQRQGIAAPAERTVIAGSSYGGLAAAYAAFRHPEWFGNVLSQSGSFWWDKPDGIESDPQAEARPEHGWLTRQFARQPRLLLRFYLEAGLFETGKNGAGILENTRDLRDVLQAKDYPVHYAETASGHDYLHWRGSLACGLIVLLGHESSQVPKAQQENWQQACS